MLARELMTRHHRQQHRARPNRPTTAAGIANIIAFLISEDGGWVNGQLITNAPTAGSTNQGTDQGSPRRDGPSAAPALCQHHQRRSP